MFIDKSSLLKLIDHHFRNYLIYENYKLIEIDPSDLISPTRFDLGFKLIYLEYSDYEFARSIYKDHIRALSLGAYREPGNRNKIGIEKFYSEFNEILNNITSNGFDISKSVIPISKNGSIANGAHRLSTCIFLNKKVFVTKINCKNHIYNFKFFENRKVKPSNIYFSLNKLIEYSKNIYIAFLWPTAKGWENEVESFFPDILFRNSIKINRHGLHQLITQIYCGEEWLGSIKDDFKGAKLKALRCSKDSGQLRTIVFKSESLEKVNKIKSEIRKLFGVGKDSIHITDTHEDAIRISKMIYNDNIIHFLNNSRPYKYKDTFSKINYFKSYLEKNKIDFNDVVLDSGILISLYGIRRTRDLDYFINNKTKIELKDKLVDDHECELKYHKTDKFNLIYNPKYHFYFDNLKFISFNQVLNMKKFRRETKDITDIKMMMALTNRSLTSFYLNFLKQNIEYNKLKAKAEIIKILKFLGVYRTIKYILKK